MWWSHALLEPPFDQSEDEDHTRYVRTEVTVEYERSRPRIQAAITQFAHELNQLIDTAQRRHEIAGRSIAVDYQAPEILIEAATRIGLEPEALQFAFRWHCATHIDADGHVFARVGNGSSPFLIWPV